MELKDLKDPIEIVKLIRTLLDESIDEAIRTDDLEETIEDVYDFWNKSIVRVYKLIESKLILLDIALINLKIHDEEKYYKLRDIVCSLDNDIEEYYAHQEQYAPYPSTPPKIIKKYITDLENNHFVPSSVDFQPKELKEIFQKEIIEEVEFPKLEITTIPDRVRLIMELGIIEHLEREFPILKGNKKKLTELLMQFMQIKYNSLQPVVRTIEYEESHEEKPKLTKKVQNVINKYKYEK
jgi:hypothetical protein